MCTLRVFAALTRSALRVFTSQTRSKAVVGRELALRPPMFGREHRTGPGRAPGDCQLVRFPKACRFAGRTTEHTVTRDGGHISRPDTEHASVVYTLDSYPLSIPSFKLSNARAKASSKFSRSNIVQDELQVRSLLTRRTLAVFTCSALGAGTTSGLLREI